METSGKVASIALLSGDGCVSRTLDDSGRRHARTLVPELQSLVKEHGLSVGDVDLVAVTTGPGSFTGLRVGIACAKTFAWACETPVIGVPAFETLAAQLPDDIGDGWLAMNAERGQLFISRVENRAASAIELIDVDQFLQMVSETEFVSGPLPASLWRDIPDRIRRLPESVMRPSAETVARLGCSRWPLTYGFDTACELNALYGRLSAAEEKAGDKDESFMQQNL